MPVQVAIPAHEVSHILKYFKWPQFKKDNSPLLQLVKDARSYMDPVYKNALILEPVYEPPFWTAVQKASLAGWPGPGDTFVEPLQEA